VARALVSTIEAMVSSSSVHPFLLGIGADHLLEEVAAYGGSHDVVGSATLGRGHGGDPPGLRQRVTDSTPLPRSLANQCVLVGQLRHAGLGDVGEHAA
jgi:hypothetical protein